MFKSKSSVVVGLTTFHCEYLDLSIPALSRMAKRFTLVIHNDNPDVVVTPHQVRALGYRGPLHIINSDKNVGMLQSRLAILDFIRATRIRGDWVVFSDDDDFLLNTDVPTVSPNNFAVIQNMVVLRSRLVDVLRVMRNPLNYTVDDSAVCLIKPHVGLAGTLIRIDAAFRMADVLRESLDAIHSIDSGLSFRPPVDIMMWSALNIIARHDNPAASPIYMDCVNYIASDLDTSVTKYGMQVYPSRDAAKQISHAVSQYDGVIRSALNSPSAKDTDE